jgi:uroporphyrinogen decarboxylase
MNSYDRVIAALQRREPDRVPTFEWIIDRAVIDAIAGNDCSNEDFIDIMDIDGIVVGADNRNQVVGKNHFIDEWGIEKKSVYTDPLPLAIREPVSSREDLKGYGPPNPLASYRMDTLRKVVRRFKGKRAIIFQVRDVFSMPRDLLGFEQLLVSLIDDPVFVRDLVEMSVDYHEKLAAWALEEGADIVFSGDDLADNRGPLFNPSIYRDVFLPGFKRLVGTVKDAGGYYIKHTDGNVWDLIPYFLDAGIDCLDPIEEPAGMHMKKVKEQYGAYIALKGNVDCRHTLSEGTEKEVIEEVRRCIAEASPGGGHILSSSNSIHSGVKPENYRAMVESVRKYGVYPIFPIS